MKRTLLCEETESQRQKTVMENQKQRKESFWKKPKNSWAHWQWTRQGRTVPQRLWKEYDPANSVISDA